MQKDCLLAVMLQTANYRDLEGRRSSETVEEKIDSPREERATWKRMGEVGRGKGDGLRQGWGKTMLEDTGLRNAAWDGWPISRLKNSSFALPEGKLDAHKNSSSIFHCFNNVKRRIQTWKCFSDDEKQSSLNFCSSK